ncbi:Maltose O-acetyltransferase [compost metagenome]
MRISKRFISYSVMALWNHFFSYIPSYLIRNLILRIFYRAKIHHSTNIHMGVKIFAPWKLVIGKGSNVQWGAFLDCRGGIFIGDNVDLTLGVKIITQYHDISSSTYETISKPVTIENNVVIGSFALLLPGVVLHEGAVLGAGSVLTKPIPKNQLYAGNPARFIKERNCQVSYQCGYKRAFH